MLPAMRVILGIILGHLLLTAAVLGQGQLIFNNASPTRITNLFTGQAWVAAPNSKVGIYALPGFGASEGSLVVQPGAITNLFAPGLFAGGTRTLSLPTGPATVQVRAWGGGGTGGFPSYEAAEAAALGGDSSVILGRSVRMNVTLTTSPTPAPPLTGNGLNAFTVGVPEPSTFALGLVGAIILVWTRRKLR